MFCRMVGTAHGRLPSRNTSVKAIKLIEGLFPAASRNAGHLRPVAPLQESGGLDRWRKAPQPCVEMISCRAAFSPAIGLEFAQPRPLIQAGISAASFTTQPIQAAAGKYSQFFRADYSYFTHFRRFSASAHMCRRGQADSHPGPFGAANHQHMLMPRRLSTSAIGLQEFVL